MGGENLNYRVRGPWTLEEGLQLIHFIELATEKKLQKSSVKVHLKYLKEGYFNASGRRLKTKVDEDGITHVLVYDGGVNIEEVLDLTIKKKACEKAIPNLQISWQAIHNQMKKRSVDDIRNYWQVKLLPVLAPSQAKVISQSWTDEDDKDLLVQIFEQEVESDKDIDFEAIDNERSAAENHFRWTILLKGLGGFMPG